MQSHIKFFKSQVDELSEYVYTDSYHFNHNVHNLSLKFTNMNWIAIVKGQRTKFRLHYNVTHNI